MRHILRIAMKFIAAVVVLGIIDALGYDLGASDILGISAVLAIVSYVVGDLFILRVTNNTVATIADFALAFVILYLMIDNMTIEDDVLSASLIGSIAITAFEIFFHRLLGREQGKQASNQRQTMQTGRPQFQTEASSELTPVKQDVRSAQQHKSQENQNKQ
ncbi:YndM family protein [Bacillus sp. ISL-40]|uniref:YndM family protein n=1 Tax=unclassified Bacillus (in: firmicutes) TaxID=185979 RepID=UPI001BEAB62E|nr:MULTISPECIES: YndM family protein [unclassified Bacillus (in: firmicutes)]MBT2701218.1 YndM family protein [Bacillus sp. ISL-40]MBT2744599.1 YndM family protein [Bacillus sp. ISL-77]